MKLKLAGADDLARVEAVRESAPAAQLIVDANEAWTPALYSEMAPALGALGVALLEQPLPADKDAALAELPRPVPVCADESCHDRSSLDRLRGRYDAVNIKLDKTGGLTEALALADAADAAGYHLMVGCMVATSLAMAPAMLLAGRAAFVDLDGPMLLARDRAAGLRFDGSLVAPPEPRALGLNARCPDCRLRKSLIVRKSGASSATIAMKSTRSAAVVPSPRGSRHRSPTDRAHPSPGP